jgi:hypothetical protein
MAWSDDRFAARIALAPRVGERGDRISSMAGVAVSPQDWIADGMLNISFTCSQALQTTRSIFPTEMSIPTTYQTPVPSCRHRSVSKASRYHEYECLPECVSCSFYPTSYFVDPNSCFIDPNLSLVDPDSFWDYSTGQTSSQNNAPTTSRRLRDIDEVGSGILAPAANSIPLLLPEFEASTRSDLTSLLPQVHRTIKAATHGEKSSSSLCSPIGSSEQVVGTRPRGRPRKDFSKKDAPSPSSDSLTKYRAKNRRASARCREKERVQAAALEKNFLEQLERNADLKQKQADLREELFDLQMQALHHKNCDCGCVQSYNEQRAQDVASAWNLKT